MESKQRSVSDISDTGQIVTQLHCRIYPTWGSEGVNQNNRNEMKHLKTNTNSCLHNIQDTLGTANMTSNICKYTISTIFFLLV